MRRRQRTFLFCATILALYVFYYVFFWSENNLSVQENKTPGKVFPKNDKDRNKDEAGLASWVPISATRVGGQKASAEENDGAIENISDKLPSENADQLLSSMKPLPNHVPKRYASDKVSFKRYWDYLTKIEEPLPEQDSAVILLTSYRSGSSLFGEFFKQHPDIFYLYEPLWTLSRVEKCVNAEVKASVLNGLVRCKLPNLTEIFEGLPVETQITRPNWMLDECLSQGVCFRGSTPGLCDDRHCPRQNPKDVKNCLTDCGVLNLQAVNNDCRRKKMMAMKVIRMCDILDLEEMFTKLPTNIKIVHLLRDPRAIANSAWRLQKFINVKDKMSQICAKQFHNLGVAVKNTPEWLKEKYMVVRYEEVASNPYEVVKSVYDFIGLDFPENVKTWIEKNTKIPVPENMGKATSVEEKALKRSKRPNEDKTVKRPSGNETEQTDYHPFGTNRDTKAILQKWTTQLSYDMVRVVEDVCADIMKLAGYKAVGPAEEYVAKQNVTYFVDESEFRANIRQEA